MNSETLNNIKQLLLWKQDFKALQYVMKEEPLLTLNELNSLFEQIREEIELEKQKVIEMTTITNLGLEMLEKEE